MLPKLRARRRLRTNKVVKNDCLRYASVSNSLRARGHGGKFTVQPSLAVRSAAWVLLPEEVLPTSCKDVNANGWWKKIYNWGIN
jgi:hypothetical protein